MKRARFLQDGLACDVFLPTPEADRRQVGLYLYGFPGSIGANAVTRFLVDEGFTAVQPHYPGTYDSDGAFTPNTAAACIGAVASLLQAGTPRNVKSESPLDLPSEIAVVIGHSFGCFATLHGAREVPSAHTLILLGPAITFGTTDTGCGVLEDGDWQVAYVRRSRPHTYRLGSDEEWRALYAGDLNSLGEGSKTTRRVVGVVGQEDAYFDHHTLRERFSPICRGIVGDEPEVELLELAGVDHGSDGLIEAGREALHSRLE